MAQVISNSGHEDMIHDAVLDYYGRRLATCSSDKTIKIFEVENETHRLTDTLKGHESAVWCISWAHPKYGTILASSSYDGQVIIWRENPQQPPTSTATNPAAGSATWSRIITVGGLHGASVNLVAWAPHDLGCLLACASSDGYVSVLEFKESAVGGPSQAQAAMQAGQQEPYEKTLFHAHGIGCNAVSWAPAVLPGILEKSAAATAVQNPAQQVRRLVTCGSDCLVRVWEAQPPFTAYECVVTLKGHSNWVRDVSWSPTALSRTYIASASQDGTVRIWSLGADGDMRKTAEDGQEGDPSGWQCSVIHIDVVAWRVSWSLSGNVLAVSAEDNKVSLWRERLRDGGWECVRTIEE